MVAHGSLVSAEDRSDFSPLKPRFKNKMDYISNDRRD